MKRLLILFSLLWTFNLFANIDLFKENTVECAIEEAADVLRNQTQTLKLVVTGELKDNSHWTQLTEAVKAREKFINLDLSKLKGLTKVGGFYFYGCEKLAAITIPPSVTSIGENAFYDCKSLESVAIPSSVTFIGEWAFAGCSNLKSVAIPQSVTFIGRSAFGRCDSLTYNEYGNGNYLGNTNNPFLVFVNIKNRDGYSFSLNPNTKIIMNGTEKHVWIKNYWGNGYSGAMIPDGAFSGYKNLTSIVIPYGVTCIGEEAFKKCENLTSVTIPDSVKYIGENAFSECYNIAYNKHNNGLYLGNANNPFLILMKVENKNVFSFKINEKTKIIYNFAFSYCSNLISVTIPNNITSINPRVFYYCSSLENITIPDSVTSIGNSAFEGCSSLTSVTIPNSVTTIGWGTFYGCSSLTSITIPDSVTTIENKAFEGCDNIESITIGSGITSIDNELFKDCENAKIYVSDLKSYLNNFSDNPRVELTTDSLPNDLVIPDGVTSIKSFAFKGHNNFTSVTIPDSVTFVGENAFSDCNNIKTLITGNGLTSLDNLPLTSALKFITIGSRINSINENTFNLCNDLTIFKVDENNQNYSASEDKKILFNKDKTTLIAYPSAAGDITIPDGVTTITSNAFSGCSNLTNVTIPDSITSIESKAFEGCNSLTSVTFKDANNWFYTTSSNYTDKMQIDVADTAQNATYLKDTYCNYYWYKYLETTITVTADNVTDGILKLSKGGNHTVKVTGEITADTIASIKTALNNNNSAKVNLDLSDTAGLTSIGENAFSWCKNLTSVVIPDSVTSVDYNAFLICNNIENLVTGNGLTSLDNLPITYALKSITIGSGINSITESTFNSCNNLTVFNVDENNQNYSVSEDGKILFNKDKTTLITCSSAANDVTIPDSVTTVNSGAFVNYKNVETLVIGNGLTSLDNLPIASSLKSITIGNNIKSIGNNAFRDCSSLTSVTIPDSVTEIGNYAFSGCNGLKNIRISKNVTKIKDYTFSNCSNLTSIAIPDSVTSIGNNAFKDCKSLTSVTIGSSVTSIGEYAFRNCSSLTSITIPGSMAKIDSSAFFGCGNLTSVTFEDIKNWSVVISSGKKKKMNVKNVSKNATNLTQNYCGNEWIKE